MKISLAMITHNSEVTLGRALADVADLVDEMVIVDDNSRDETVEIAEGYGAIVLQKKFEGFSSQKQYAIDHCTGDWILLLDDDEYLDPKYHDRIRERIEKGKYEAFKIPRTLLFMKKRFRIGSEHKDPILRLFRKGVASMDGKRIHEGLQTNVKTQTLPVELLHESYQSYEQGLSKMQAYASLWASSKTKKVGKYESDLRSALKFIVTYIFKLNIFNGKPGYYWSRLTSFYQYKKYNYLYLQNQEVGDET